MSRESKELRAYMEKRYLDACADLVEPAISAGRFRRMVRSSLLAILRLLGRLVRVLR